MNRKSRLPVFTCLLFALTTTIALPSMALELKDMQQRDTTLEAIVSKMGNNRAGNSAAKRQDSWTLLIYWSLDCIPCERDKPRLSNFNSTYGNLEVLGISTDGINQLEAVQERVMAKPVTFPNFIGNLSNVERQFTDIYRTPFRVTPTYVLYSAAGQIRGVHSGPLDFASLAKRLKLQKPQSGQSLSADVFR